MALAANRLKLLTPGRMTMLGGSLVAAQAPGGAALLARLGLDYFEIDGSSRTPSSVSAMAQLGRTMGIPAIVRVPEAHRAFFGPALEGGAWGLSIPGINDLRSAQAVVSATRYWPLGLRGTFEPGPQNDYLDDPQDLDAVNKQLHITIRVDPSIEERLLCDMAALNGIDAIEFESVPARALVDGLGPVIGAVKEAGALVSAPARTAEDITVLADAGVQMIRLADDIDVIASHFENLVTLLKETDRARGAA